MRSVALCVQTFTGNGGKQSKGQHGQTWSRVGMQHDHGINEKTGKPMNSRLAASLATSGSFVLSDCFISAVGK